MHPSPVYLWSKLSDEKWVDAWEERLKGSGINGAIFTSFPGRSTVRVEVYCPTKAEVEAIRKEWGGSIRVVKSEEWMKPTPKRLPLKIRDKLVIVDTEDANELDQARQRWPDRPVLGIPSEMAFGTGDHPTTATCLRFLADDSENRQASDQPWEMLDLGCGSGILALAARLFGAKKCLGLDFDPAAIRIAKVNTRRNDISKVSFEKADVLRWTPDRKWPVVAANLFSTILLQAMPVLARCTEPQGTLFLSGILFDQAPAVLEKAAKCGFTVQKSVRKGKWVSVYATRQAD